LSAASPTPRAGSGRLRAVLFDAGNTLVFLDYARMAQGVGAALGLPLSGEALASHAAEATEAMEQSTGDDKERATAYLEALFRLGGVPPGRMGEVRDCLAQMHRAQHLWCSVADRTHEALGRLRSAGFRLGVVSNSDGRVEQALQAAGLIDYFDIVIDSHRLGIEKPDPAIFRAALDALSVRADEAIYVGDLYEVDVVGARAAGIEAVLLTANRGAAQPCRTASSIAELADVLLTRETMTSSSSSAGNS
jgi:HAD superfamily hydrolase (TIGR01509 family)